MPTKNNNTNEHHRIQELEDEIIKLQSKIVEIENQIASEPDTYKQIFDFSNEAIAIFDNQGKYIQQNAAHEKLFGFSDSELKDNTPAIHLGHKVFENIVVQLQKNKILNTEIKSQTKFGEKIIDLSAFAVTDKYGKVVKYIVIKRNITEKKKIETRINKVNKVLLEEKNFSRKAKC